MNELQVFSYQSSEVRTVMKDGEPWFVLKDVCAVLGITNHKNVAARLDDDEKGVHLMDSLGGKQAVIIINESGLYSVILRFDKPEAKPFRKWVTGEVLPAIRKTGTYIAQSVESPHKSALAEAKLNNSRARVASVWLKMAQGTTPEYEQICKHYASAELTGGTAVLPLPEAREKTYIAAEVGKLLGGVSANMVGRVANQNGLKVPEYGLQVWDKSKSSAKQVPVWRYNDKAVSRLRELIGGGTA